MATKIIFEIWTDGRCSPSTAHDIGVEAARSLFRQTSLTAELVSSVTEYIEPHDINELDDSKKKRNNESDDKPITKSPKKRSGEPTGK